MAINYNEEEYGLQIPNTNQGIMEVADLYNTPDGSIPYWGPEQYNYNEGMLNTPSNPETLNFTEAVNEYGYPLMASLSGSIPNKVSALDQMANYDWSGFDNNIAKNMALAKQMNTSLDNTLDNTLMSEALIDENRIPGRIQESVPNYQSGWDKFTGKIGDMWSGAKDKLSNFKMPPIGIMGLLQGLNRNPFDIDSPNYSKGLGLQVDDLREVGFLPQNSADGYKILGGPLAGKNLVSAFGTNDYDQMLAKKFAWFQKRKDAKKGFSQKNWDKLKKEQEDRAAEMRAHGQRGVGERTLGGNFQIERGGSDAVNRDLARREAANRNRSRAARQDTTSMRSAGRSYTDAQGNRGYSRGRRDGGRIGYANGGLASLFTRRG